MDEAFKSRIHMSLYYPPLSKKFTLDIFEMNPKRTQERKGDSMRVKTKAILDFAEDHWSNNEPRVRWNGRQIRNAFHIATALAENEA